MKSKPPGTLEVKLNKQMEIFSIHRLIILSGEKKGLLAVTITNKPILFSK